MTHCSSRKTSGLSAWEFPAFPFLTRIEGIFVVDERSTDWIPTCTELLFVWVGFLFCFVKCKPFHLSNCYRNPSKHFKKWRGKVCFISCFAWAKAAWLTRKADLFLKALLQFVMSVAKLERLLLSISSAHIVIHEARE